MDLQDSTREQSAQDLTPDEYEEALHRMKRDLALLQLKRRLRQSGLTASEILEIAQQIEQLQTGEPVPVLS